MKDLLNVTAVTILLIPLCDSRPFFLSDFDYFSHMLPFENKEE